MTDTIMRMIAYTKPQQDFATRDAFVRMGIDACVPVELGPGKSRGKNRMPEMHERAIIPRVVLAKLSMGDYHQAMLTGAARAVLAVLWLSKRQWDRQVQPFIDAADFEREMMLSRLRAGEQIQHFKTGEQLLVKAGPLKDAVVEFMASVDAHNGDPRIRAKMAFMGGQVPVDLDPLFVERKRA